MGRVIKRDNSTRASRERRNMQRMRRKQVERDNRRNAKREAARRFLTATSVDT